MKPLYLLLLISFILYSCGEKVKEAQNALNVLESLAEAAENMEENIEKADEKRQERIERGDTTAMHYEDLAEFLPNSIPGYEPEGEMDGNTTNMPGMSFSTVAQSYRNDAGDRINIAIIDYNAAYSMYNAAMAFYGTGLEIESTEEKIKGFAISDEVKGWEVFKKKTGDAELFAGVASRFYVTIDSRNQEDSEFIKEVLQSMPLDDMSDL